MFDEIQNPFDNIKSEYLRLKTLEKNNVLIRPTPLVIGHRLNDRLDEGHVIIEPTEVKVSFIPLRNVLKQTLEYSNLYNLIISNINNLMSESNDGVISNFVLKFGKINYKRTLIKSYYHYFYITMISKLITH